MKKPILLGILGLFIGYILYLVILFVSPSDVSNSTGGLIAIITGVVFFFVGRWYYSKGGKK
jgi:quinol-cytochrome oxidoreductase complex cytochrome b subunit